MLADTYNKDQNLLPILDGYGNLTGKFATKQYIHHNKLWHNEVVIFLINQNNQILLQKRSNNVNSNKGKWGLTADHIEKDETPTSCLIAAVKEELGLDLDEQDFKLLIKSKRDEIENKFTYFYFAKIDIDIKDIQVNKYLVDEIKFIEFEELKQKMLSADEDYVFKPTQNYLNIFGELETIVAKGSTSNIPGQRYILISTEDGFTFPGTITEPSEKSNKIVIFVHGSRDNFYKNILYKDIQNDCAYNNIACMICNNRGSDMFVRLHKKTGKETQTVFGGTMYQNFDESLYDLEAQIDFAIKHGYKDITLVGHSLGCSKILWFCENSKNIINKIIFISPVDHVLSFNEKYGEKSNYYFDLAKSYVEQNKGNELITEEYSAITISSIYTTGSNADIFRFRIDADISKSIAKNYKGNVEVILASNDHVYKNLSLNNVKENLVELFSNAKLEIKEISNTDHTYVNSEKEVSREIVKFVSK